MLGQGNIAVAIADDKRARQVDGVVLRRALQHARLGLAAGASVSGGVRAIVNAVKMRILFVKPCVQECVNLEYQRLRKVFARNARLVSYHNYRQASLIQPLNGCRREGKDT